MIHVRLPKSLVKRLDHAAIDMGLDRGRAVQTILERYFAAAEKVGVTRD